MDQPDADVADIDSLLPRFGLREFRPGQRDVIDAICAGHDVLCVMPTGGGKSLCYQLPSLARAGTTIVISPLIALMKDQVDALRRHGIAAELINSSLSLAQQDEVMQRMAAGMLDLVYVAPERLRNGRFLTAASRAGVSLLAIDEAHCISEWGHDFRPDYARLGQFRARYLSGVQTIALTATATPHVRADIMAILEMRQPREFVTGFARDNLRFSVQHCGGDQEKDQQLLQFLRDQGGSGIIYAATRRRCEEIAEWLPQRLRRPVGVYHAGMEGPQRRWVQEQFMSGKLDAIVATNAFGMGIDKPDIRFVVHYNFPGSLEAYYQEAGRAGRDGALSHCRLLFAYADRYVQEYFIENRYPSPAVVRKVYEFLLAQSDDPIELTLQQVRDAIEIREAAESVGTAETLLARAGVLKRLDSSANAAILRIDSDLPTLVDLLPREAKLRRRVLAAAEKLVGARRGEDVYVRPQRLAEAAGVDRDQLSRTLRELARLKSFDYVPPFRGRAIHIIQRDVPFEQLQIDFDELARRKAAEYEKLEAVIEFARTHRCRQRAVLGYFGDPNQRDCGLCDRCDPAGQCLQPEADRAQSAEAAAAGDVTNLVDPAALTRAIRVVLSGIKRMHGRFGKVMIAQMLGGSRNKKIQQWNLNRLSTFGLLSGLAQADLVAVIDATIAAGMALQVEVDQRRPTVQLTEFGQQVMHARQPLPESFPLPTPLARRLARRASSIEGGDVAEEAGRRSTEPAAAQPESDAEHGTGREVGGAPQREAAALPVPVPTSGNDELAALLRRWRGRTSAALAVPAYRVLTNATIQRLATERPQTLEELAGVSGIGPATIEQYGQDLIEMIRGADTCPSSQQPPATPSHPPSGGDAGQPNDAGADHGHDGDADSTASAARPQTEAVNRDAYWTWRMFRDGYPWRDIEAIRGRSADCLLDDLAAAARLGHEVQPTWAPTAQLKQTLQQRLA